LLRLTFVDRTITKRFVFLRGCWSPSPGVTVLSPCLCQGIKKPKDKDEVQGNEMTKGKESASW